MYYLPLPFFKYGVTLLYPCSKLQLPTHLPTFKAPVSLLRHNRRGKIPHSYYNALSKNAYFIERNPCEFDTNKISIQIISYINKISIFTPDYGKSFLTLKSIS